MTKTAQIFTIGGSQAVRLPAEYHIDAAEVDVRRDKVSGDIILSSHERASWSEFMKLRAALGALDGFSTDRQQGQANRDPLQNWSEH